MTERPHIPIEVQRQVLFEARHRCAVCGEPTPLERAHIRPWSLSKSHAPENLVALCANCHSRADNEKWGEATLRLYKERPHALLVPAHPMTAEQKALVDLIIAVEPERMTESQRVRLASMVAAYAGVHFTEVRVLLVGPANSVRVRMEIPAGVLETLLDAAHRKGPELQSFLEDLPLLRIELVARQGAGLAVAAVHPAAKAIDTSKGALGRPWETLQDVALAISEWVGIEELDAARDAQFIMGIFGHDDRVIDAVLEPEDRQLLYLLEEKGFLTTEREETTLYDGREWRTHYWVFKRSPLVPGQEEEQESRRRGRSPPTEATILSQIPLEDEAFRAWVKAHRRP